MTGDDRILMRLDPAAPQIADADLLLWRCRGIRADGLSAWLTAVAGRGEHYHAAMAAWWNSELMCLESRLTGVRAVTLESRVREQPGGIDVFSAVGGWEEQSGKPKAESGASDLAASTPYFSHAPFSRAGAVAAMRCKTGRRYGVWNLLRTSATHMVLVRLLVRAELTDNGRDRDDRGPEFCSEAVSSATRLGGGVDPVPHLRDRMTEPADLAHSAFYEYRFTLIP